MRRSAPALTMLSILLAGCGERRTAEEHRAVADHEIDTKVCPPTVVTEVVPADDVDEPAPAGLD